MKLIQIKNLNLWIQEKQLLKNINLEVELGEIIGLVGESGSGKTLLTKCILGILPEIAETSAEIFNKDTELGAVLQNAFTSLNPTVKIGKQLKHLYISQYGNAEKWQEKVEELCYKVGLDPKSNFLHKFPHELSGGEQQRVVIVGALIGEPKFLIADEVTTALDVETKQEIIELFRFLQKEFGLGILFVTHDMATLQGFADKIYIMYKGELVSEDHPYARKLFALSENIWRRER